MVDSVEGCREIEENQDRAEGGCLSSLLGFFDSEECSICRVARSEAGLVGVQQVILRKEGRELVRGSTFKSSGVL